jgi:hypothetical protein
MISAIIAPKLEFKKKKKEEVVNEWFTNVKSLSQGLSIQS